MVALSWLYPLHHTELQDLLKNVFKSSSISFFFIMPICPYVELQLYIHVAKLQQ